jgi:hypothetical protein
MEFDEILLVQILIGLAIATALVCAILLLQPGRTKRASVKKSKPVERRPADRYTDELAA